MRSRQRLFTAGAVALASLALALPVAAGDLELKIELPAERFIRGCTDAVEGLVAAVTVTNTGISTSSMPAPALDPLGGTDFEVYLIGAPYGEPTTPETPARTPVGRHVRLQPIGGDVTRMPDLTLRPGDSKQFRLNVGRNYRFRAAGRYEMTCLFEGVRSNTVTFEVLPLKRVDVVPPLLLMHLADYECGDPDFPFMFYIAPGQDRFDQIIFLARAGSGPYEHYEYHGLAKVAPGVTPEMVVAGSKVGALVPDKADTSKTRFFALDFGAVPMTVTSQEFVHEPGAGPSMSVDDSGNITAR